jgi:hypothetical protein
LRHFDPQRLAFGHGLRSICGSITSLPPAMSWISRWTVPSRAYLSAAQIQALPNGISSRWYAWDRIIGYCSSYDTTNWIPSASLWRVCLTRSRTRDDADVQSETGAARWCRRYQVFRVRLRKMAGIRAASSGSSRHAPIMTLVPCSTACSGFPPHHSVGLACAGSMVSGPPSYCFLALGFTVYPSPYLVEWDWLIVLAKLMPLYFPFTPM